MTNECFLATTVVSVSIISTQCLLNAEYVLMVHIDLWLNPDIIVGFIIESEVFFCHHPLRMKINQFELWCEKKAYELAVQCSSINRSINQRWEYYAMVAQRQHFNKSNMMLWLGSFVVCWETLWTRLFLYESETEVHTIRFSSHGWSKAILRR